MTSEGERGGRPRHTAARRTARGEAPDRFVVLMPTSWSSSDAPTNAEHMLARMLDVRLASLSGDPVCSRSESPAESTNRRRERFGVSARYQQASRSLESNSRAAGVSAVMSAVCVARAWNALLGITRAALSESAEDPERATCGAVEIGKLVVLDPRLASARSADRAQGQRRAGRCRRRRTRSRAQIAARRGWSRARAAG